jgi:hypothetical protein
MNHEWITDNTMTDYEKFYSHFNKHKIELHHAFQDAAKK